MSLKSFHIVFISVALCLAFGFAIWSFSDFSERGGGSTLVMGSFSAFTFVLLAVYGVWFLRKLQREEQLR